MKSIALPHADAGATTKMLVLAAFALALIAVMSLPEIAVAQDAVQKLEDTGRKAYELVFTVVYWLAALGVLAVGAAAFLGRLEWHRAGQVIGGIFIVFAGTSLVDYFR
jgi:type IV secretory pathway VirB2 component (pilin)